MEGGVAALDWAAPWYAPWRVPGQALAARIAAGMPVADALNGGWALVRAASGGADDARGLVPAVCGGASPSTAGAGAHPSCCGASVRSTSTPGTADTGRHPLFVPQAQLPQGVPYERYVHDHAAIPTRDHLHDFFNGLCWLRLPCTKRQLNRLQAEQIAAGATGGRRGPVRDAVTVFDENGAVLQAPAPLWEALLARQWRRLFVDLRPLWAQARLLVVGHALLEQLAAPRKGLTAHVWCEPAPAGDPQGVDAWLAGRCTAERLAAKPFTPLPVLGVPGWWPASENFSFYDDSMVFRPRRGAWRVEVPRLATIRALKGPPAASSARPGIHLTSTSEPLPT